MEGEGGGGGGGEGGGGGGGEEGEGGREEREGGGVKEGVSVILRADSPGDDDYSPSVGQLLLGMPATAEQCALPQPWPPQSACLHQHCLVRQG